MKSPTYAIKLSKYRIYEKLVQVLGYTLLRPERRITNTIFITPSNKTYYYVEGIKADTEFNLDQIEPYPEEQEICDDVLEYIFPKNHVYIISLNLALFVGKDYKFFIDIDEVFIRISESGTNVPLSILLDKINRISLYDLNGNNTNNNKNDVPNEESLTIEQ